MSKRPAVRCSKCGQDILAALSAQRALKPQLPIGQRVLVTGKKHPWKGHVGVIIVGLRKPSIKILPMMYTIRVEAGNEFMARPDELKVVE